MKSLQQLQSVIDALIAPDGCSWDKVQTPDTLADYMVEESHELVDALLKDKASVCAALGQKSQQLAESIRKNNSQEVCEELGDVAFLLLFITKLYEKKGEFTLDTVLNMNAEKMIRRHPHVFADATFENMDEQLKAWEAIKRSEKGKEATGKPKGIFDSLPKGLPPLIKAYRIHSKAARVNFTWPEDQEVEQQAEAEWLEWIDVAQGDDKEAQSHELGDILFTLVELGRRKGIKANEALDYTTQRFLRRFEAMEALGHQRNLDFASLDLDAKDELWNEVKEQEKL